jgi:ADP-heptose:LPS heptosyltransferase
MVYFCDFEVNETKKPIMLQPVRKRSLVLFPGALGDFICFLPALEVLSKGEQVHVLARSEFADLVSPAVSVGSLERYEIDRLFVPGAAQEKELRDFFGAYSSVFSWMGSGQSAFVRELASVSQGRAVVFPFQPGQKRMHQVDYYLACVGHPSPHQSIPQISLKPEALAWSENYWHEHSLVDKQVIALAPGSGSPQKNWPASSFRAVADWWREQPSGAVMVLLGPVEEEKGDYAALCRGAVQVRNLSLGQLAALLMRSDLHLGNDSGVSHLAAAIGVVSLVLFGPSSVDQWAPRGKNVTVFSQNVECAPCAAPLMKSCPHRMCLTALQPESIIKKLDKLNEKHHLDKGGVRDYSNSEIRPGLNKGISFC